MTEPASPEGGDEANGGSGAAPSPSESDVPRTIRQVEGLKALGFFPADHAAAVGGKVYANGAYWTHLRFPSFPATLPVCALVAVLQIPYHQTQKDHTLLIRLLDGQGKEHPFRAEGGFRTAPTIDAEFGEAGTVPFAIPITGLEFQRPGAYRFILEVDGRFVTDYSFRVIQTAIPGLPARSTSPN